MIVDIPARGITEDNIIFKPAGQRCKHLAGNKPGEYECLVHGRRWYRRTPCADFGQIEAAANSPCRMGAYILKEGE